MYSEKLPKTASAVARLEREVASFEAEIAEINQTSLCRYQRKHSIHWLIVVATACHHVNKSPDFDEDIYISSIPTFTLDMWQLH